MRVFILEDDRNREEAIREALRGRFGDGIGIVAASSAEEARAILELNRSWDLVFLDHDLAGIVPKGEPVPRDGQHVAHAIVELGVQASLFLIQSVNADGAQKIKAILEAANHKVLLAPYHTGGPEKPETIRAIEQLVGSIGG